MNQKDSRTYFEEWLSAYCDHLHIVRQSTQVDVVKPTPSQPPLAVSTEKNTDAPAQRKPSV